MALGNRWQECGQVTVVLAKHVQDSPAAFIDREGRWYCNRYSVERATNKFLFSNQTMQGPGQGTFKSSRSDDLLPPILGG